MKLLDGKSLAASLEGMIKEEVSILNKEFIYPTLAVILVGDDVPSASYVRMKSRACERVGINSLVFLMPTNTTEEFLIDKIKDLNADSKVHGILVQLPLPSHINTSRILETIDVRKDVDGFHPLNMGKTMLGLKDSFAPATPLGVMHLLRSYEIDVYSRDCVVIGSSNIVGKPLSALLLNAGASVSICHSASKDVTFFTKNADLVFVGVGKARFLQPEIIKDGAIIIDIGINRIGDRIVGDVDFDLVAPKCEFISPVPGGVGPMTIISLLQNTLKSAREFKPKGCK